MRTKIKTELSGKFSPLLEMVMIEWSARFKYAYSNPNDLVIYN